MSTSLDALRKNAKRLRSIYAWTAVGAFVIAGLAGAFLRSDPHSGPLWGLAGTMGGAGLIFAGSSLYRWRSDAKLIRILLEEPQRVARIHPKLMKSSLYGVPVSSHTWMVVALTGGERLEVYAPKDDLARVVAEIRACAPDAPYDARGITVRTNVRIR